MASHGQAAHLVQRLQLHEQKSYMLAQVSHAKPRCWAPYGPLLTLLVRLSLARTSNSMTTLFLESCQG